jgi:hypothetical protein
MIPLWVLHFVINRLFKVFNLKESIKKYWLDIWQIEIIKETS